MLIYVTAGFWAAVGKRTAALTHWQTHTHTLTITLTVTLTHTHSHTHTHTPLHTHTAAPPVETLAQAATARVVTPEAPPLKLDPDVPVMEPLNVPEFPETLTPPPSPAVQRKKRAVPASPFLGALEPSSVLTMEVCVFVCVSVCSFSLCVYVCVHVRATASLRDMPFNQ